MMFSKDFREVLNELSDEIQQKRQELPPAQRNQFTEVLYVAVDCWCHKLIIPDEVTFSINHWQRNQITDLTIDIWKELKRKSELQINFNLRGYMEKLLNQIQVNSNDTTFILVIAFIITSVGYALYLLKKQRTSKEESYIENRQSISRTPYILEKEKDSWALVLVINVGKNDILQSLKTNRRVMPNEDESLYSATQALWIGSTTDFSNSTLGSWFSEECKVPEAEQSEYDVYFVQIELNQRDIGFTPNANQIDRLDAFRRLPSNSRSVTVSPRLPSKAYENTGVYSR